MSVRKAVSFALYVLAGVLYFLMLVSAAGTARILLVAFAIAIVAYSAGALAIHRKNRLLGGISFALLLLSMAILVYRFWKFVVMNGSIYAFCFLIFLFAVAFLVALI